MAANNGNSKDKQLDYFREMPEGEFLTTNQGVKINHNEDSLKAGERGPTLLEDFQFREKLTHFDHEPIPERVVHARGSGAHGFFQVYDSMEKYTMAKFLQDPSKKTPVFVRFSQVVGSRGSADTVRDVRGFATKFYTEEGNYDLVGNNIPVFFIQDAIKFPDLVHSIKPEPHNDIPQASAAHDNFWDFISLTPESTHMILWLLSDRGISRSYRMVEGFGVNTFRFVNAKGKARFVKFHWKPMLGIHSLVWDEAQKLAGKDPDYLRRDLWEAIEMGDYPEYELGVQMIEEADENEFDFDVLDPTKIWPEEEIPVKIIGKMTLNRNPENFFAETEQVAFCPANIVPGIDLSNDPLLQGRLFSYLDTQLIRLGGPNFQEIPINRTVAKVHNNQRDGYHRHTINTGRTNYFPNSIGGGFPKTASHEEGGFVTSKQSVEGMKVRARGEKFKDYFSQAVLFWNSMSEPEKHHIIQAFHFEIGKVGNRDVKMRMVELINNVNHDLAVNVAEGVGVEKPPVKNGKRNTKISPTVSMADTVKDTIKSRKIAILLANGFDTDEFTRVKEGLERSGAHTKVVSKTLGPVKSASRDTVEADKSYITTGSIMFDAVFIPGGKDHIQTLKQQGDAVHFINEAFKHCKAIGATSEGVDLLASSQINGVEFAKRNSSSVVSDRGIISTRNSDDIDSFLENFSDAIAKHRHWEREKVKDKVPA